MNESLAPQLRFESFTAPWERRHLGDVVAVVGGGTPSTRESAYWGGEIDWFSPSEIGSESIAPRSRMTITAEGLAKSAARLLPAGRTVLYTSRASIGHSAILQHEAATNQGFQSLVVGAAVDVNFIHAMTPAITEYALKRASGSTFLEVSARTLREMVINMPSLPEQQKIGALFSALFHLTSQHQRKHDRLQQTKIALMQRMFPQDDTNEPVLRFRGFEGAWERRKLGNLGTSYGGLSGKTKQDFGHGAAHYVTYMDVFQNSRILDASRCGAVQIDPKQNEVKKGDALFTVSSETPDEVGMSAVWLGTERNVYLNSFCFGFRPRIELDPSFFAYALRSGTIRAQFRLLAQGISRFNISKNKAMDIEIQFPSIAEQQVIGQTLSRLDDLISAEQLHINKLQQVKTGLLQKMFI